MRKILFAAALSISSVALAQSQPPAEQPAGEPDAAQAPATEDAQPSGETVNDPSQATGPEGITQQGTDPNGQATAPPGTNQPPQTAPASSGMNSMPQQSSAFTPRPAAGEYPPCSRTVTDACIQTYERGVRPRRGR